MRILRYLACTLALTAGCSGSEGAATGAPDAGQPDAGEPTAPSGPIAERSLSAPEPWAAPLGDYISAGEAEHGAGQFITAIQDLAVYEGRLYLGYGDANVNMGRVIPIGIRSFPSAQTAEATNEFDTDDEQVERFRHLSDELWVAGIDATEDAWLGNVYLRGPGEPWQKRRTVQNGVHVHDVARFQGATYAVGSGSEQAEWEMGDIYAHLWRTEDRGESFTITRRIHNGGNGDARWVRLLPGGEKLYLFGYTSNVDFQIDNFIGATFDGETVERLPDEHPLRWVFASETDPLPGGAGLVRGVNVRSEPLLNRVWHFDAGSFTELTALHGMTVADVFVHAETEETLLLVYEGDDYAPQPAPTSWNARVLATTDFETLTEVATLSGTNRPVSIAFFEDHLFFGMADGQVLRSAP